MKRKKKTPFLSLLAFQKLREMVTLDVNFFLEMPLLIENIAEMSQEVQLQLAAPCLYVRPSVNAGVTGGGGEEGGRKRGGESRRRREGERQGRLSLYKSTGPIRVDANSKAPFCLNCFLRVLSPDTVPFKTKSSTYVF